MDVKIYIIECALTCLVFGVVVMASLLANPILWIADYPPEIQERYYQTQGRQAEKTKITAFTMIKKVAACILFLFVFAWMAHFAGADTFREALLMSYGYIFILFAFDTFFLDWVLFANLRRIRLPGTEDMDREYHQKWFHVKACLPMIPLFLLAGILIAWLVIGIY